ncbi:hypothetical protein LPB19_16595 [Marinobacter salinisoli]|uniref:Uncharacterized protein n=1 Tax=Marinobacter salinisoli TaxID=2769486 RepID=A0ABX7MR21_9GAMM|nr:hypothetical protein [Marinobacter salinisoli]QSP94765.1 hypothetical protein LPB19_16595 [Marinobacter salinisoli]
MFRVLVPFLIIFVSGCANNNYDPYADNPVFKVHPDKIVVTEHDIDNKRYRILDDIKAKARKTTLFHDDPTQEDVNKLLKQKASMLGADAIIFVRYGSVGIGALSWGELEGQGRAVKFVE